MTRTEPPAPGAPQPLRAASRLARRLAAVIAECHYAQQRILALRVAPDSYLSDAAAAPDTYQDFLFRTSGPLLREPPARAGPAASGRLAEPPPCCATESGRDLPPDGPDVLLSARK